MCIYIYIYLVKKKLVEFLFGFSTLPWPRPENASKTVQKTHTHVQKTVKKRFWTGREIVLTRSKTQKKTFRKL